MIDLWIMSLWKQVINQEPGGVLWLYLKSSGVLEAEQANKMRIFSYVKLQEELLIWNKTQHKYLSIALWPRDFKLHWKYGPSIPLDYL